MKKLTLSEFIERAKKVHGDKYDYSKVDYVNAKTKVCIVYPGHGEFWQKPFDHLNGHGGLKFRKHKPCNTREMFIEKAHKIHGDKYDYSKTEYVNAKTKVCIICPEHGEFWITPNHHLNGRGCKVCSKTTMKLKLALNTEEFIEKACKVHGDRYDYSKVKYNGNKRKVCIVCSEHGKFWQTPNAHLSGQNCPRCSMENYKLTNEEFIKKAKRVHADKYDYSKVVYEYAHKKVCIVCPEHGEFWQTPSCHLKRCGCPNCKQSKLEQIIHSLLLENDIVFEGQKRFNWLRLQSLDFYLPNNKIAIECQGVQHYKPIAFFGGSDGLEYVQKLDKNKNKLCNEHGIELIYFSDFKYDDNVITDSEELLKKIKR